MVVVSGSLAFDYIFAFRGRFADHILREKAEVINLSFLVDSMIRRRGGVATNYAYTLSLLGQPAAILGMLGEDGGEYRLWLETQGIDCRAVRVLEGEQTSTGFTIADLSGNQITGYYGGAMLRAADLSLADAPAAEALIVGPSTREGMLRLTAEAREAGMRWVFDPSHNLPQLSGADIEAGARGAWILIGNDYEMEVIRQRTGRADAGLRELAEIVVTTFGAAGSAIATRSGEYRIPPAPPAREVDPVGAGDAYRAGLVAGLLRQLTVEQAGRIASAAASFVVEQAGTVEHSYTRDELAARYQEAFGEALPL